jgi:tol-pal system protein YbgF
MDISAVRSAGWISAACLALLIGCVNQNEVISLDTRLSELEMRFSETRKNNAALKSDIESRADEEQSLRRQAASLRQQIAVLTEEIRTATGRIEELEFQLNRQKQKETEAVGSKTEQLDQVAGSTKANDERIRRIEQYLNLETATQTPASQKEPAAQITPVAPIKKETDEDEIYRQAKQAFDQGNSEEARKKFSELIERYPKSERTDNAQFWIGEIYYREKWYEKAILEYQKVIENYPKGNKVPASLLKQGFAFLNLGDKANARIILQELIRKFPQTNEAKIAKEKLDELK